MLVAGVIEDTLSAAGELELVSTQLVVVTSVTTVVRIRHDIRIRQLANLNYRLLLA